VKDLELTVTVRNNRLKERRAALGMNQKTFCAAVGIDLNQYQGLESLRVSPLRTLRDYRCMAHGCPNKYWLGLSPEFCAEHAKASDENKAAWRSIYRRPDVTAWTKNAEKLAAFYGVDPGELFPDAVLAVQNNRIVKTIDGAELMTFLGIADHVEPELLADEKIEEQERAATVRQALALLPKRDRKIIEARYGLLDGQERTSGQIGSRLGISASRVAQIEGKVLRKLWGKNRAIRALR
jgi:RNA polymerase sigma factor (sigma-70 family)